VYENDDPAQVGIFCRPRHTTVRSLAFYAGNKSFLREMGSERCGCRASHGNGERESWPNSAKTSFSKSHTRCGQKCGPSVTKGGGLVCSVGEMGSGWEYPGRGRASVPPWSVAWAVGRGRRRGRGAAAYHVPSSLVIRILLADGAHLTREHLRGGGG
jgi:hypothetical protein